jgi:ribosomal protein S27AE
MKAISLKCSNCGAGLSIPNDIDHLACGFCGSEQTVERAGGIVALKPLTQAIKQVQVGTDKTAAELALHRLGQEWNHAISERGNLVTYWQQQCTSAGASTKANHLLLGIMLGIVSLMLIDIVLQLILKFLPSPWPQVIAFFFGAIAAGLVFVFFLTKGQKKAEAEETETAARRDEAFKQMDSRLRFLTEQIERNRAIVNS